MLAVAQDPSAEMLANDPSLRRLDLLTRGLKWPVIASLALVAIGIVLTIAASPSWWVLLALASVAWLVLARAAVRTSRDLHLGDYDWRLEHGSARERNVLVLAQRAVWSWGDEIPDDATHAVLVADEIGGPLRAESFLDWETARKRVEERPDLLAGERKPVVVALVELDATEEPAVIRVVGGRIEEGRRALESLPKAEDGWLVGV